jgi:tetrahydromethanopterin S-methyltransferase subunit G
MLPMSILRQLIDLDGYSPYASIHRFDDDPEAVTRRLDEIEKMLSFYAT